MLPALITLQNIPGSESLEADIRRKVKKLGAYCQRIQRCRILIKIPQKHKLKGREYVVRIDLTVPGKQLAVNTPDENVWIAIRDAFEAVRRQLEHYEKKRHHHSTVQHHRAHLVNGGARG